MLLENVDLSAILEEKTRELVKRLLNFIERLSSALREARAEIQRLRDEVNRLKGEQGKPNVKANVKVEEKKDRSSEKERHKPRKRQGKEKVASLVIAREEVRRVDRALLPADAVFKGYEENVVQDVLLKTENVRFLKEKYYSPSLKRTYLADLPTGYSGQFGPGIKTLAIALCHGGLMSEPKFKEFLESVGVQISEGMVSNLLIKGHEDFHAEKEAVYEAGLASSVYQHLDDTPTRFNGKNHYGHILCNRLYTAYFTKPGKDRLTVLRQGRKRIDLLNVEALAYLEGMPFSKETRRILEDWRSETVMEEEIFIHELALRLPNLNKQHRSAVLSAAAVAAYHAERGVSIVQRPVVYLDESGFAQDMPRQYGYASVGKRCGGQRDWHANGRLNIIGAWFASCLLTVSLFQGSINTAVFSAGLEQDLLPKLPLNCVIIMDNASFHRSAPIRQPIADAGHDLEFLPTYSPDLNPIEKKWAQAKAIRRQHAGSIEELFSF